MRWLPGHRIGGGGIQQKKGDRPLKIRDGGALEGPGRRALPRHFRVKWFCKTCRPLSLSRTLGHCHPPRQPLGLHHPPKVLQKRIGKKRAVATSWRIAWSLVEAQRRSSFDLSSESAGSKQAHHQGDRKQAVAREMDESLGYNWECGWLADANGNLPSRWPCLLPEDVITPV